jgi:hypothetical protein
LQHIVKWQALHYQDLPDYENFRQLLEAPVADAHYIMQTRFPVPHFIETEQGGSQVSRMHCHSLWFLCSFYIFGDISVYPVCFISVTTVQSLMEYGISAPDIIC